MITETTVQPEFPIQPTDIHHRLFERNYGFHEGSRNHGRNRRNSSLFVSGIKT